MSFADFHFAEPCWLWLAAVAPIFLAWLFLRAAKKRREQLVKIASPNFIDELTASHSPARRHFKNVLLLAAFALAGLALARPQWGSLETAKAWVGEDVVFVLDCSRSMLATDVSPSRLARAKFSILDFVRRQSHGRVGLVAFAGSAFIQCPLTFDYDAFEETLLAMDADTIPIPGTDIGRALDEAYRAMDKNSRRKLIVLVTDGEDLEKDGVTAAKNLATNNVVIFTIGVGTPAGKDIQYRNPAGRMELVRDAQGNVVRSRLDEKTLREIAGATGGSYYPLGALGEGLTKVRTAIHTLDSAGGQRQSAKNGVERFHWFVAAMLALLVIESLAGTRRKNFSGHDMRRFATLKKFALPLALAMSCRALAVDETNTVAPVTARDFYNAGTKLLDEKKFADAEQMFESALAAQVENVQPPALYNLGHARFDDGAELLKKGPSAQSVEAFGNAALADGKTAIQQAQSALADKKLDAMIAAYLEGRGARHELRDAEKAVRSAMETFGKTLEKWQRAADDFKSAAELNPADTNATRNAQIVEQAIARLVDSLQKMPAMMAMLGNERQQLGALMKKLRGQIPAAAAPPGSAGDDDDDDDGGVQPDSLAGQKENAAREGDQMQIPLSPDQAGQILNGLSLDASRRLPMSDQQSKPRTDNKGRDW